MIAIRHFCFANNCLKFTNMEDDLHAKKPFAAKLHPLHFGQTKTIISIKRVKNWQMTIKEK